jgi:hypothetical protein
MDADPKTMNQEPTSSAFHAAPCSALVLDVRYIRADLVERLHSAAGARMMADDPTGEQRLNFLLAWGDVGEALLQNND